MATSALYAPHPPVLDRREQVEADLDWREQVERWFTKRGVPHFRSGYSIADRYPLIACLLFAVVAFEIGVAPWLDLSPVLLLLAPAYVIAMALLALPELARFLGLDYAPKDRPRWARWFLVGGALVLVLVQISQSRPILEPWIDFAVILAGLCASVVVAKRDFWRAAARRQRRRVVSVLIAAIVLFALDGNTFTLVSRSDAALVYAPQALPALGLLILLLWHVTRLDRAARAAGPHDHSELATAVFVPAVPMLCLVLSAETAVFPTTLTGTEQVVMPLAMLVVIVVIAFLARLSARAREKNQAPSNFAIASYGGLFLLAYPICTLVFSSDPVDAAVFALIVNGLYLAGILLVVYFGLDHLSGWAWSALKHTKGGVVRGIMSGLPLLLVFSMVFMLAGELWQVVIRAGTFEFYVLVAVLVLATLSLMVVGALKEVNEQARFDAWTDVCSALDDQARRRGDPDPVRTTLADAVGDPSSLSSKDPPSGGLKGCERLNATAVVLVYQAFVFIPLAIVGYVLFLLIATAAVPADVAGEWVYGDAASAEKGEALRDARGFIDEPWTRVALILVSFSLLYFAAELLTQDSRRGSFFEGADRGIRQRLAARAVYRERLLSDEAPRSAPASPVRSHGGRHRKPARPERRGAGV